MNNTLNELEIKEWMMLVQEAKEIGWSANDLHQLITGYKLIRDSFEKIGIQIKFDDLFSVKQF